MSLPGNIDQLNECNYKKYDSNAHFTKSFIARLITSSRIVCMNLLIDLEQCGDALQWYRAVVQ